MPAFPTILKPSRYEIARSDKPLSLTPAKGNDLRSRLEVVPAPDAMGGLLLDYASFVLDQEARYCQL